MSDPDDDYPVVARRARRLWLGCATLAAGPVLGGIGFVAAAHRARRLWRGCATLAVGLVVCGVGFVAATGEVRATEFSPHLWRYRTFTYYRVPLLGLELPGTRRVETYTTPELEFFVDRGLVAPVTTATSPAWHFVHGVAWDVRGWNGPAKGFRRELSSSREFWELYATSYPDEARAFWRDAARELREGGSPWEAYREVIDRSWRFRYEQGW